MSNTNKTGEDIDIWLSDEKFTERMRLLTELSKKAGIYNEFCQIPPEHIRKQSYDQFWINVLALSKIKQLKIIADCQLATG